MLKYRFIQTVSAGFGSLRRKWLKTLQDCQQSWTLPSLSLEALHWIYIFPRKYRPHTFILYLVHPRYYSYRHHHVESVHFRTSKGQPLHPALAAVQTLSREYFVLKDNGMEVGNEENGVYEAWMEVLMCDSNGVLSRWCVRALHAGCRLPYCAFWLFLVRNFPPLFWYIYVVLSELGSNGVHTVESSESKGLAFLSTCAT